MCLLCFVYVLELTCSLKRVTMYSHVQFGSRMWKTMTMTPVALFADRAAKEFSAISTVSPRISIQTRDQGAQTETSNCPTTESKCAEATVQALCLTIQYLTRQVNYKIIIYFLQ